VAALTSGQIVDRVRSLCANETFGLVEAVTWVDFDLQPESNSDAVYRVPPMSSQGSRGGFGYYEDRDETLQIWVARKHNDDYHAAARLLSDDVHSLTAAVMRDGLDAGGDYGVTDEGRGHQVDAVPGATYLTLRLSLPINYDAQW
jgi:hypothetical protein